jgi:hypothetical protein
VTPPGHRQGVLSVALAHHLAGLGLVKYPATSGEGDAVPAYCNSMPDAPSAAVGIFDRPGPGTRDVLDYITPEVQVIVRGETGGQDRPTRTLCRRIRKALHDTDTVVWGVGTDDEVELLTCDALDSAPAQMRPDRDRPRWTVGFRIEHQQED